MTQQALRELVAKWRKTFEEQKDNSTYFLGWGDACSSHADELEALLGEQREAQGADLTNLRKALIKQLSRDASCQLGEQTELRQAAKEIGIFVQLHSVVKERDDG